MLPAELRITDGSSFAHAVRRGRRAASTSLVVHVALVDVGSADRSPARVGVVVSRVVGNAVVRNRVKRRVRHLMAVRWPLLPEGADVVVRALPAAANADSARLGQDLDHCLRRLSVVGSA